MEKVRIILPKKINLVLGDTFQLFYRSVVDAPNPYVYSIFAVCEKGRNFPRYFEMLPDEEGEFKLTLYVYGAGKVLLGEAETILCVSKPVAPKEKFNILCIGDSITSGGEWVSEANRRLTGIAGTPEGHGFDNICFLGGQEKHGVHFEAFGGWKWETFVSSDIKNGMWVNCIHNKSELDQHSLWKDDSGNIWQIEAFELTDFIKFNRYMHDAPYPKDGKLTHYKNAINQEDIDINFTSIERPSPFLDLDTKTIDFKKYCEKNGYDKIDLVYILLGGNGIHEAPTPDDHIKKNVKFGKILVDAIHNAYPDAKVVVAAGKGPSIIGGTGANYGATLPFCDTYGMTRFSFNSLIAYEEWSQEDKYADFLSTLSVGAQFDIENGYPGKDKPANLRSSKTEFIGTNGSHPTYEGYMQVADAFYRDIITRIKEFNSK